MNHPHPGFLANYNSLTDKHLAGYFSNTRIRHHLQRSGLISRSGRIISEKEYQLNAMRKDHQKYIRECLAQAIFHKVLDMERHHQVEIKRKHENSAKRERVHKIKVERSRRAAEETNHLLSPHPPTAPRNRFGRRKLGNRGQSSHLASYPRPSTAPGNIQHPVRLQPLYSSATTELAPKAASSSRPKFLTLEKDHHLASGGDKGVLNPMHSMDYSTGISPYRLPIINNYVTPIPPLPPPKSNNINAMKGGTSRGRRFRPTTAPNGLEQLLMRDTGKFYKPQLQSNAYVTMVYLGKTVHLSYDLLDYREEIKIYQQHCGGENLCVFRGKLLEGDTFQFISKRHYGFPFSLTFYLNGIQVDRLSSCCEYKHRKGTRLGGKHGYFGLINVERSSPCYRCIIAMGLDKKPSPPKKKVTGEDEAKKEDSGKEKAKRKLRERSSSSSSGEGNKYPTLSFFPTSEGRKECMEEMELEARKGEIQRASDECEKSQKRLPSDAYDEDFEADEEKSDGKVNEEGQPDDQMNGMSKSPSDDEKDNLDHERENKNSSPKGLRASDSERDESDGYAESDLEKEDKQGKAKAADWEMDAAARKIQCFYRKHKDRRQTHGAKLGKAKAADWEMDAAARKIQCFYRKHKDRRQTHGAKLGKAKAADWEMDAAARKIQHFYRKHKGRRQTQGAKPDRKHAPSPSSRTTTLYSSENDSECESRKEDGEQDDTDIHSEYESETATPQREEGQETDVEEEEGMGEAETTTAKHVPGILLDNKVESNLKVMSPVSEKPELVGLVDMNTREDREEEELVHFKSSTIELESRSKESSKDEDEGDSKSVKEKIAEAIVNDQLFSSEPEPSDSSTEDEEEMVVAAQDKHEVPDGASLAKEARVHELQKVAEQVDREKQMVGEEGALKEEELVDEEGPKEGTHEEEFIAQKRTVEHSVKNELVTEDTDLEKEAVVESDLDSVEEEAMYEEEKSSEGRVKAKQELKAPKETAPEQETSNGKEILGRWLLEGEELEGQNITEREEVEGQNITEREEVEGQNITEREELEGQNITEREELEGQNITEREELEGQNITEREEVEGQNITEREEVEGQNITEREEVEGQNITERDEAEGQNITEREEVEGQNITERDEVEGQNITEEFMASKGEEGREKVVEACEVLGTIKLVGEKAMEGEAHEAEENMEEALQAGKALGTTFAERGTLGEAESEGIATLKDTESEAESIENDVVMENKCMEDKSLKADEYMEEGKYLKMELGKAPLVHAELIAPEANMEGITSIDETTSSSRDKSIGGGNDLIGEVPSDMEKVLQVEKLGKTSPEMSEMKNIPTEDVSMLVKQAPLVEEPSQVYESTTIVSATEEETMKDQGAKVVTEKEEFAGKANSEAETVPKGMVVTVETAEEEGNVVRATEDETEQGWMEDTLMSKVAVPERKQGIGKEELFAENVPETTALVTEETIRHRDAERKIVVQGKVEGKEAERETAAKGEREDEAEETESEGVPLVTGLEGETVSKMTIMRRPRVVSVREETVAKAKDMHELPAQNVALGGGALNKEEGMENEASFQDEVEQTPEEAVGEETSIFLAMHKEEITVQEETEDEESDTEEQMKGEGTITRADIEEALLIGIQQLFADVSQMNEDKDDKEDMEEEPQMEGLAEDMSPQEDAMTEDFFTVMVTKERWVSESDKAEEIGTGESVEGILLEGKCGGGNRRTSGQEECPTENVAVTAAILRSTQWSEREQHQGPVGSSD